MTWKEPSEVTLDIEVALNGRPLSYMEDDIQQPVLTPNSFLFVRNNNLPDLAPHHLTERELRNRAKFLAKCKKNLWCRWTREYLRGLRERHNLDHPKGTQFPNVGDVVVVQTEYRNRAKWPLGIVIELYPGCDGIVRSVILRAVKSYLKRAVQQRYPLELSRNSPPPATPLNPAAPPFRPHRDAAVAAKLRIISDAAQEDGEIDKPVEN